MKRILKLILILIGYELLAAIPIFLFLDIKEACGYPLGPDAKDIGMVISLLTSNILIIWHLIHFGYVKTTKQTWSVISPKVLTESIILGLASIILIGWLGDLVNLPDIMSEIFSKMINSLWGLLAISIAGPVAEELLFRGGIQGYLLKKWKNPNAAIFVSALIFGVIHGNPAQIIGAFLFGLVLGWLYYRSGSLLLTMIIHIMNNTIVSLLPQNINKLEDITGESLLYATVGLALVCFIIVFWQLKKALPAVTEQIEIQQEQ